MHKMVTRCLKLCLAMLVHLKQGSRTWTRKEQDHLNSGIDKMQKCDNFSEVKMENFYTTVLNDHLMPLLSTVGNVINRN